MVLPSSADDVIIVEGHGSTEQINDRFDIELEGKAVACSSLRFVLGAMVMGLTVYAPTDASADNAEDQRTVVQLVADGSAEQVRMIAVGISSLANLRIDNADVDIDWVIRGQSIDSVLGISSDMALLDIGDVDLVDVESRTDLRAVMTFWPSNEAEDGPSDVHSGYLLVARSAVSRDFIHAFLDAVQDDVGILKAAQVDTEKLNLPFAMVASPMAMHEGASSYLAASDAGISPSLAAATVPTEVTTSTETVAEQVVESS